MTNFLILNDFMLTDESQDNFFRTRAEKIVGSVVLLSSGELPVSYCHLLLLANPQERAARAPTPRRFLFSATYVICLTEPELRR